jgi:transposase-like protein
MTAFQKLRRAIMSRKGEIRRPWTDQELQKMLQLLKEHKVAIVAKMIGRSRLSVQDKVHVIRVRGLQPARPFNPWSDEDREKLRRIWPDHTKQQAADALGRSVSSVQIYARYMGLKKSQEHLLSKPRHRIHAYPPELKEVIRLAKSIKRKIDERKDDCQLA